MPERHAGDRDARDVTPEPWAISQASAPTRSPSRGRPVGAGVGEEPAGDPDGETDQQRRGRRGRAAQRGQQHQRAPVAPGRVPAVRVEPGGPWSIEGAAKSWPGHHRPPGGADVRCSPRRLAAAPAELPYRGPAMRNPDEFDAFYKDARDRLLLQTYALTGDLPASRSRRSATPSSSAWHHWRKVSRLEDPEAWVRPPAWAHAQRRHTARLWHRDKGLDPEAARTLDALGKLPIDPAQGAAAHPPDHAAIDRHGPRGRPDPAEAERELQTATAQFALHRDVPTTASGPLFEPLREHVESVRWPRPSILRRAGRRPPAYAHRRRRRRRGGARWSLSGVAGHRRRRRPPDACTATTARPTAAAGPATRPAGAAGAGAAHRRDAHAPQQLGSVVARPALAEGGTGDNTAGDGLVLPCQQYAVRRPQGHRGPVPHLRHRRRQAGPAGVGRRGGRGVGTPARARRTYATPSAGTPGARPRAQLLSTRRVGHVGDEATLLVLRAWNQPATTMVVGVARTGRLTATTMSRVPGTGPPDLGASARLLAAAVTGLCDLPDAGACSGRRHGSRSSRRCRWARCPPCWPRWTCRPSPGSPGPGWHRAAPGHGQRRRHQL